MNVKRALMALLLVATAVMLAGCIGPTLEHMDRGPVGVGASEQEDPEQ